MKESEITVVIDSREQTPLDLARHGLQTQVGTLQHGDYSLLIPDLRKYVSIERKSISDFVACCGKERDRFEREILAMRGYPYRFVVCEFAMSQILGQEYRSKIHPNAVLGSVARFVAEGVPILFAESHEGAGYVVARILYFLANSTSWGVRVAMQSLAAGGNGVDQAACLLGGR